VKLGRRPKPPEDRRSELVQFKCKPEEADSIYRGAIKAGLSVREFVLGLVRAKPHSS
jgi:hypothetical protein